MNQKTYEIRKQENDLVKSFDSMLPLILKLKRLDDHEYYTSLSKKLEIKDVESTSQVKAGWIYYFKDWNAISLNFKTDRYISIQSICNGRGSARFNRKTY